jgi:hypothetical protein
VGAPLTNSGGRENGSRPEKIGLGTGPPSDGDALTLGPVDGPVTPPGVDGPTLSGGSADPPPLPNCVRPSRPKTSTAATMPPTFRALRSRSLRGIGQAPVGPGTEPGPALWSLVYIATEADSDSSFGLVSVGAGAMVIEPTFAARGKVSILNRNSVIEK